MLARQLAVGEHDVVSSGVGKLRIRHLPGQAQQLVADRCGSGRDPVRHRSGNRIFAFDRRLRKARIAKLDTDIVKRQPERVRGDLRHDRIGAGADVGRCASDVGIAVGDEARSAR